MFIITFSGRLTTRLLKLEPRAATCRGGKFFILFYFYSKKINQKKKNLILLFFTPRAAILDYPSLFDVSPFKLRSMDSIIVYNSIYKKGGAVNTEHALGRREG